MNRLTGGLRLLADNHVTQRYMPPHRAFRGSREPLAIDVETWVLAPDAFLANHRGVDQFADDPEVFKKLVYETRFDRTSPTVPQSRRLPAGFS